MAAKLWLLTTILATAVFAGCAGTGGDGPEQGCEGPLGKPLSISGINALDACCQAQQGQGHCLATAPAEIQPYLEACPSGGYCIPDSFLATGAAVAPATCTAFGGPGVCLSKCIPQVAENEGLLQKDTCTGADELCIPCTNPLDGMPTGACELSQLTKCVGDEGPSGPAAACDDPSSCNYDDGCPAVIEPSTLEACGADAHCVDASFVSDPAEAAQLGPCADPSKLCVPDVFLRTGGKFTAKTCTSINGAEGRCLSQVLPDVAGQAAMLPQDTCAASEKCTPCFNPLDGSPTGACTISCDAGPTQAPTMFASCCDGRARCVPASSIPADQQDQLDEQECEDDAPGSLCVPTEIIANGPFPTCTANSFILGNYSGVCLSNCLDFGLQGLALARGTCNNHYTCAPCTLNGQPTNAPGCN